MIRCPEWSNELLADVSKIPVANIVVLKKKFTESDKNIVIKTVRRLFGHIPDLSQKKWQEIDQQALKLWKRFKKATKG